MIAAAFLLDDVSAEKTFRLVEAAVSRVFRLIIVAISVLVITPDRAHASYILTVPLLGDRPETAADFGAHPQLSGAGAEHSSLVSLYPSSLPSFASPYVTNLLGTIGDSSFADRFNPADIALALHTSVLVHQGGNGKVILAGFGRPAGSGGEGEAAALATQTPDDQGENNNDQGNNRGNGPPSSNWSGNHEDGKDQGEDEDEDEDGAGALAGAAVMPEPGSMILLGTGLLGLGAIVRRTRAARR